MLVHTTANGRGDFVADAFAAIEFELALHNESNHAEAFDATIARACLATGARVLFVMPPAPDHLGIVQLSAVSLGAAQSDEAPLVFVVQEAGPSRRIRLATHSETSDRFFGFAKAYAQLMNRLMPIRSAARA